jgi:iron complex outermembrane receptor protein
MTRPGGKNSMPKFHDRRAWMRATVSTGVLALLLASSARADAPDAAATQAKPAAATDEIIVSATKSERPLRDVPVSVSVTSAETIQEAHIVDLKDLQSVVPSLMVQQANTVAQTNFIIRGFGNGSGNDGLEGSVGVFVDGVYRSHSEASMNDLPDVNSIEVLRGPQSTLFGKNVSAGAITITTAEPQFTYGADAEVSFGNYNLRQEKLSVTGPLSDTVAVKLSGMDDMRDGYLNNTTTGQDVDNHARASLRADTLWAPNDLFKLRVIADYGIIHDRCCGAVQLEDGGATDVMAAKQGAVINLPSQQFDNVFSSYLSPTNHVSGSGISAQADWNAGFAKITSITAYRDNISRSFEELSYNSLNTATYELANNIKTFTQELRAASTGNGPLTWLTGAFYDHETLRTDTDVVYGPAIYNYMNEITGGAVTELETLQHYVTPTIVAGGTYFQPGQGINAPAAQTQDTLSLFGHADYKVTDHLTLTGGLAYLFDRKAAALNVTMNDPFSALNLNDVPQLAYLKVPVNAFAALNPAQFFYADTANHAPVNFPNANENGVLEGNKLTHSIQVSYDFGVVNTYLTYATGWKAGAFNLSYYSRPPNAQGVGRSVNPEDSTLYEAGLKAAYPGGYFNFAIFNEAIRNFQTDTYEGTAYVLENAGQETSRGVEIDTRWRPIDWLMLTGSATYLNAVYNSYANAPCTYNPAACVNGTQNLTGTTPAGIPRWSLSTSATLTQNLTDDIGAYLRGEVDYSSKDQVISSVPPNVGTWGNFAVNASLGFVSTMHQAEAMLWVRNLTNYRTMVNEFPTVAQTGSYSGYPNEPRTFGITLRKQF